MEQDAKYKAHENRSKGAKVKLAKAEGDLAKATKAKKLVDTEILKSKPAADE